MPSSSAKIDNRQQDVFEWLRNLHPFFRFMIGLLGSCLLGFYAPLLLIVVLGKWTNVLTSGIMSITLISLALVQNLIGCAVRRIWATGIVACIGWNLFIGFEYGVVDGLRAWLVTWPNVVMMTLMPLLSAYALDYYMKRTSKQ